MEFFSEEELIEIMQRTPILSYSCILINTEKYFLELSSDIKDEIELYYIENNGNEGGIIDKKTFFELLRESSPVKIKCITIDE